MIAGWIIAFALQPPGEEPLVPEPVDAVSEPEAGEPAEEATAVEPVAAQEAAPAPQPAAEEPPTEAPASIDPHFGVRLGYGWVKMNYGFEGVSVSERISRGVATLGGGIDGFVTNRLALGVRADMHIMFGGEYCRTFSAGGESVSACAESNDVESRADPRDWPLPFSFLFQMRYTWDVFGPPRRQAQ
jgi:hypothetical protein